MPLLTSESVLADLRRLPLLTPEQLARVEAAARKGAHTPERIVRKLAAAGWVTTFQAEAVLTGRAEGLAFGPYLLLDKLGSGGMGSVYKARHLRLGRVDALKVIRSDKISSKLVARRFLREIRLTSSLEHPHIVRALDAGQVGRQLYLATEFVPGEDLATAVLRGGPLSVADACLVAYQISLALQHVHDRGLVHRDLKPSNLMRDAATRAVKLLDLGLSGFLGHADNVASYTGTLTSDGVMLGTPDFMPPEQIRDPHGVDIRADLYALGCTLFYLLTGRTPYTGNAIEKLAHQMNSPSPPLVLPNGPAPPALAAIVGKLMAKRPEDRYPTPQALTTALLALRPGQPAPPADGPGAGPSATGPDPRAPDEWQSQFDQLISRDESSHFGPKRAPAPKSRRASWAWVALPAVAALFGAGLLAAVLARSNRPAEAATASPPPTAAPEDPAAEELRALRKAVLARAEPPDHLRQRVIDFRARHPGTAPAAGAAGLLRRLPSPLDRLVPVSTPETEIPGVWVGEPGPPVVWMGFAPGDDRLFVARRGAAPEEWALPTLAETRRFKGVRPDAQAAASLSADGQVAVAANPDGTLTVCRGNGAVRTVDPGPQLGARVAAAAPDGRTAVVASTRPEELLARVDLESGKVLDRLKLVSGRVSGLTVSADGGTCLVLDRDDVFQVVPITSGRTPRAFDRTPDRAGAPAGVAGPDGQRLYLTGVGRTAARYAHDNQIPDVQYEVEAEDTLEGLARWHRSNTGQPTCIAVSADETAVAVGTRAGNLYVYAASTGKLAQQFRLSGRVRALAFSTHGRVLAVGTHDGTVVLIPLKG